jgi:ATP-dependent DNA helicase RecG
VNTWNANRPHGFGVLNPDTFAPYPKNPVIGAFFREIDRADELGSGMRKMMMYGKKYGGADPQLIEGDVFRMIISVPEFSTKQEETVDPAQIRVHDGAHDGVHDTRLTETMKKILVLLVEPKSTPQLLPELGYPRRTRNYEAAIKNLLDFELIEMTLPDTPRSKNQRYRQTEKGKSLMNGIL